MATSQADLLEAIPFIRDITPLDLLGLPTGLFESLPKPCNLKRSATAGGPIWPPVLTNVLVNGRYWIPPYSVSPLTPFQGLLILHHKPHLVGKQGLEEHYNWLSAFIYRQTRGWDQSALARNTTEAKRTKKSGERVVGIIRNRKQISSKVQTIGEYLKDTHWAYVTQGPRSLKDASSTGPAAGLPASSTETVAKSSPNNVVDQPLRNATSPDVSHVSLQLAWSPPTPFSLPASPSHLPFLYPDDVPHYDFIDARLLGYDPRDWPEFEGHSQRMRLPITLDHVFGKQERQTEFDGSLLLTSASITVHFDSGPSHVEGVSPSLLLGTHQLVTLSQEGCESIQTLSVQDLDRNIQRLVQTNQIGSRIYHVDLPIHLPSASADRTYLANDAGPEFKIECSIIFHAKGSTLPHNEELKAVADVYFFSEKDGNGPERLEDYHEATAIKSPEGHQPGFMATHGLATRFAGKIWEDSIEESRATDSGKSHARNKYHADHLLAHDADLSGYHIVQHVLPRSHRAETQPLLTIIYSPRLVTSAQQSAMRLVIQDHSTREGPTHSNSVYEPARAGNTPKHTTRLRLHQPDPAPRRSSSSGSTMGLERHSRHLSKSLQRPPTPSSDSAGPIRNTRSHSRSRGSILLHRPVTTASPLTAGIKLPLTPRASPLLAVQQPRSNSGASPFLHPTTAYNPLAGESQRVEFTGYTSIIPQAAGAEIFDSPPIDSWSSIMGTSSSFPLNVDIGSAYENLSNSPWPYPRDTSGELRQHTPTSLNFHDSHQHDITHGSYTRNDRHDDLVYYGGASWC